jgi:hypothetical protein
LKNYRKKMTEKSGKNKNLNKEKENEIKIKLNVIFQVIGDPSSQTFSIHAGFFIQCFALSPNANQVIVTTKMGID